MATSPVAGNLLTLKEALQELESVVQQPADSSASFEGINQHFPTAFGILLDTLRTLLSNYGESVEAPDEVIKHAHSRGWLRGDLPLWLHMVSDYECIEAETCTGPVAQAVCQDIRACTCILWQTYELLMAKFRWQTQVTDRK